MTIKSFSDMRIVHGLKKGLVLIFLFKLISCNNRNDSNGFVYPADFDPVNSTCFIWTDEFNEIIPQLAGIISKKDKVTFYYHESDADTTRIYNLLENYKSNLKNVNLIKLNNKPVSKWIRDFGPVYLVNSAGEKKVVDFGYFDKRLDFINEIAVAKNIPVIQSTLNSSGGARETNGRGTLILCETHELDVNKPKTKAEIETELKERLAVKTIIWMKRGLPQDDSRLNGPLVDQIYPNGVNGHVDQFVRFANANTVLISSVTQAEADQHPILAEAKKRLDENYRILVSSNDQDGKKLNVITVPLAPLIFIERPFGDKKLIVTPVTSYLNFIVTNSLVILPSYLTTQKDDTEIKIKEKQVEVIFRKVYPDREIIQVESAILNFFSGGFHCISINEPYTENLSEH